MPVYHSGFNEFETRQLGNVALLPIKTTVRGPAPPFDKQATDDDVIDESIQYFRANCLFRNFEIKGSADRVLIYLTLFIHDCLMKLSKAGSSPTQLPSQVEGTKILNTLAVGNFSCPGDGGFPLNALYQAPVNKNDAELLRQYVTQLRQETVNRLLNIIYVDGKLSKWWMSYTKRKFMGKSLS